MTAANATPELKAPFPAIGGKSRVADIVWDRIGNVDNWIEPFCFSAAVTLRRPVEHFQGSYRVETLNDANCFVVNAWRAIKYAPDEVAKWADNPVLESDLHAFHKWLVRGVPEVPDPPPEWTLGSEAWNLAHTLIRGKPWNVQSFKSILASNPEYYDAKVAGRWIWGAACWIGGQWCADSLGLSQQVPDLTSGGCGDAAPNQSGILQIPELEHGRGVASAHHNKRQALGNRRGVTAPGNRPQLADAFDIGRGVNASAHLSERRPMLSFNNPGCGIDSAAWNGTCEERQIWLTDWMRRLSDRFRLIRTCYGHWSRICDSDSTLTRLGTTGLFLDPPYSLSIERMHEWVAFLKGEGPEPKKRKGKASRADALYATDKGSDVDHLVAGVHAWCLKWGGDPNIRICVAGYEGEHNSLEELGWEKIAWATSGGYGNQRKKGTKKNDNGARERLWFSPACVKPVAQPTLFDGWGDTEGETS